MALDSAQVEEFTKILRKLIEEEKKNSEAVQMALARLEAGRYNTCIDCEEEINIERLRRIPTAQRCISCEGENEDKLRKHREARIALNSIRPWH